MSDTPRTDAAIKQLLQVSRPERVSVNFARELERELIQLEQQYDELADNYRDVNARCNAYELEVGLLKNELAPLETENAELRRTHQGGQTAIECAELAAQNHALRKQLSETSEQRKSYFQEIQNLREEISRLRWQQRAS